MCFVVTSMQTNIINLHTDANNVNNRHKQYNVIIIVVTVFVIIANSMMLIHVALLTKKNLYQAMNQIANLVLGVFSTISYPLLVEENVLLGI